MVPCKLKTKIYTIADLCELKVKTKIRKVFDKLTNNVKH